jgi:hypothetical protein
MNIVYLEDKIGGNYQGKTRYSALESLSLDESVPSKMRKFYEGDQEISTKEK